MQNLLRSRIASWILGISLLFVMGFAAKILIQKYRIDHEIAKLQGQVQKIKSDNQQMSYLIQYFQTPDYQDKSAREKLNLKKDGEVVIGLPLQGDAAPDSHPIVNSPSNFTKWFNYFFSKPSGQ
ncbi:MAG: septum formation initiator family protein [Candidatus Doudnabacteria bacterium]